MKFPGKIWLIIILKVSKTQGFTLSLENIFFGKPQGGSIWPFFEKSDVSVKIQLTTNIAYYDMVIFSSFYDFAEGKNISKE